VVVYLEAAEAVQPSANEFSVAVCFVYWQRCEEKEKEEEGAKMLRSP
jgi:hypothetical protein